MKICTFLGNGAEGHLSTPTTVVVTSAGMLRIVISIFVQISLTLLISVGFVVVAISVVLIAADKVPRAIVPVVVTPGGGGIHVPLEVSIELLPEIQQLLHVQNTAKHCGWILGRWWHLGHHVSSHGISQGPRALTETICRLISVLVLGLEGNLKFPPK